MFGKKLPPTRRQFLRQAACAAVGTAAITNTIWDLRLVRAATTASFSDYKALVCIFLFGGNDANNLIVPTDTASYNAYATARGNLATTTTTIQTTTGSAPAATRDLEVPVAWEWAWAACATNSRTTRSST